MFIYCSDTGLFHLRSASSPTGCRPPWPAIKSDPNDKSSEAAQHHLLFMFHILYWTIHI